MNVSDTVDQAITILAKRRLRARQQNPSLPAITSPTAWLAKTEHDIATENANTIAHLNIARYTPEQLADRIQNGAPKPTPPGWKADKPHCRTCEGNTWTYSHTENDVEYVKRCPTCYHAEP